MKERKEENEREEDEQKGFKAKHLKVRGHKC